MKRVVLLILSLFLIFISVLFYQYNKNKKYLQYTSNNLSVILEIESYLNLVFSIRGELPHENEINEFLLSTDSTLFKVNEYSVEIDRKINSVLIYTYGPDGQNQDLNDVIDARYFSKKGVDVIEHCGFLNLLFNKKYDVLLFKDSLNYSCSEELINGVVFVDKNGKYFFEKDRLNSNIQLKQRLSTMLSSLDLKVQNDDSNSSTIYIYNGIKLKNMCDDTYQSLTEEKKNKLFQLMKKEFKDYNFIKFPVALIEDDAPLYR